MEFYCKKITTDYSKMYESCFCVAEIDDEDYIQMVMNNIERLQFLDEMDRKKVVDFLTDKEDVTHIAKLSAEEMNKDVVTVDK